MTVYCTVPTVTAATVGVIVATTLTSVAPIPAPFGDAVEAAPAQLASFAAAPVYARRPWVVTSAVAQYKSAVVPLPICKLAAVEPVKATRVSILISTICEPAGNTPIVSVVAEAACPA
jgi:hypothetical protein